MPAPTILLAFLALVPSLVVAQKAGLPWILISHLDINQFLTTGSKVDWYYTYSTTPVSTSSPVEFVPMLPGQQQVADWDSSINSTIQNLGVTHVLGFNEPNEQGGANLDPVTAAVLWKQHIQPLKAQGVLLGSPAPSDRPNGLQWLKDFMQFCNGCTVDFIAMHEYTTSTSSFTASVEQYHNAFPGKPIWVTEWACEDFNGGTAVTEAEASSFMKTTQAFLDSASYVERYAWFGASASGPSNPIALMDTSGKINALGEQYIGE
ncbi:glycoside hydrolase [Lentinus tigrinus ALCF2SS1-7]|uniref:Glycoside hydrolase n=1 Tax=Lentinus tigrinus ALCF2SS1-6 TaxID=1328759 RepID=A0A5C2SET0_9APHY|nr:glycoside hydrolase [Lentinus tigrinus ALCF2SS1-6]RPD75994.1 glycoside hydrolase [Lentinus tigrinus ALCF2SS1-7]